MKRGVLLAVIMGIISVFLFSGCLGVDRNFTNIRNDLLSVAGSGYHKKIEISLGSLGLGFAGMVARLDDKDKDAEEIVKNISGIQIGVYKNYSRSRTLSKFSFIRSVSNKMRRNGWEPIIKSTSCKEVALVYVLKNDAGKLSKMFVISLKPRELAMVEIRGNLEKIFVTVIKDKGLGFMYADAEY